MIYRLPLKEIMKRAGLNYGALIKAELKNNELFIKVRKNNDLLKLKQKILKAFENGNNKKGKLFCYDDIKEVLKKVRA